MKRHTYHGEFQKYFIRFSKEREYTVIADPQKNGREEAKTTALSIGNRKKNYFYKLRMKLKRDSSNFKNKF